MKKTCILISILVVITPLLVVSEVIAQAPAVTPSRTCSNSLVSVVAGPCFGGMVCDAQDPTLAAEFPRVVNCPNECNGATVLGTSTPLSGEFLRWDILFTRNPNAKYSPSLIGTQVAADIQIEGAVGNATYSSPGIGDSALGVGVNDWDSRWLKFPGNSSSNEPFLVSYFTKTGVTILSEGVSVKSGGAIATCGLAGAGSLSTCVEESQPLVIEETLNLPGCIVSYRIGPNSKPIPGSLEILVSKPGQTCTLDESGDLYLYTSIDGQTRRVLYFPGEGIVTGGSCSYISKVPTAAGYSYQRVTCTTCCPYGISSCCMSGQSCNQPGKICCNGSWITSATCP